MKQYDAAIIGFGKGGKTLAAAIGREGKRVALIERSSMMYGGTCINVGCIPTKALVRAAERSSALGGSFEEKAARYAAAIEEKGALTGMLREKNYTKLNSHPNVEVIDAEASFMDAHTLRLRSKDGQESAIEAQRIFINTGSRPFVPPIEGLRESKRAYTSETLMDLRELPRRLAIIGGGYIGMEFASIYAGFGAQVTVVQDGDVFLPREDAEIAEAVRLSLERRGVRVIRSATVLAVRDDAERSAIHLRTPEGEETLWAQAILIATGRRANVQGLNLEAAGVALTERGAIRVDERLRTTAENIWAMGDVTGGQQFTYISLDDARIVRSQLLEQGERTVRNRGAVPYSVFLDPPFSRVGLGEQEARAQGYEVLVARLSASAIPKAQVLGKTDGLLKAVVDAKTGEILGAHLFCAESHEMINLVKLAMDARLPYTALRDGIYTHPTMSEALNDLFGTLADER